MNRELHKCQYELKDAKTENGHTGLDRVRYYEQVGFPNCPIDYVNNRIPGEHWSSRTLESQRFIPYDENL